MSWFKPSPTRAVLIAQISDELATGVRSPVPDWLTDYAEQTPECVHAEWVALQRWITDYTIQKTLQSYDKVRPLWEAFEQRTREYVRTRPCYERFQEIADARSQEYGDWFNFGLSQCKGAQPLLAFSAFVATRLLKPEQPLQVGLDLFEQELNGADMCDQISTLVALSSHVTDMMNITVKFLKSLETQVPRAFQGPMQ